MLRNGEQLLLAVVIPVIVLIGGVQGVTHLDIELTRRPIDAFTPGVLALAVMSTAFTSLAIATGFERRYGVIKRLAPRRSRARGCSSARSARCSSSRRCRSRSSRRSRSRWAGSRTPRWSRRCDVVLGTAAFASLGLFVAGVLRAEATLAAANLVYLLLMVGGAVVLPSSSYGAFGEVARLLPSGRPGRRPAARVLDGSYDWASLLVLVVWAGIGAALTARTFTWE